MATAPLSKSTSRRSSSDGPRTPATDGSYELPGLHMQIPGRAVEIGFWGTLAGATLLGAVDPPLALLVGAGVVVARHRRG